MITHVAYWFEPDVNGVYNTLFSPLVLGVEPFFVLGGYLAAFSFRKFAPSDSNQFEFSDMTRYLKRRWLRTIPNYFLFLVIYAAAFSVIRDDYTFDYNYLTFTQNLFWLAPRFFSVSWSLATQEWFYLLLPIFMLLSAISLNRWQGVNVMVLSSVAFIVISFIARYYYISTHDISNLEADLRRIALLRIDSVAIGVLVGWFYLNHTQWYKRNLTRISIITGIIVVALCFLRREDWFNSTFAVQMTFYPSLSLFIGLIIPLFHAISKSKSYALNMVILKTSQWSYSIYLCHVFLLDSLIVMTEKMGVSIMGSIYTLPFVFIWIVMVYISVAIIYRYFETPFIKIYNKGI